MTREEISQLLQMIRLNYPQSFKGYTAEQSKTYADLWYDAFKDKPTKLVIGAVKAIMYGDTREFAPNIGQVNAKIHELTKEDDKTEMEAWNIVKKALSRSGWYSTEEFAVLPDDIKKIIGSPNTLYEWSQTSSEHVNTVIQSNFMRSYRALKTREKQNALLPDSVSEMLGIKDHKGIDNKSDELLDMLKKLENHSRM